MLHLAIIVPLVDQSNVRCSVCDEKLLPLKSSVIYPLRRHGRHRRRGRPFV
jgi:hypothetical protein